MAIMDTSTDEELVKVYQLVSDIFLQIWEAQKVAKALRTQVETLKHQSVNAETGLILRRFNTHLTNEEYEAELERMNVAMTAENQQLQHDNKQLGTLLKEFEQTLEQVMSTFRTQAYEVQKQELGIVRQYESILLQLESASLEDQLTQSNTLSLFFAHTSHKLRSVLRLLNGEEPEPLVTSPFQEGSSSGSSSGSSLLRVRPGITDEIDRSEWALERECELARLEKENEELRWLLKASEADVEALPQTMPPRLTLPPRGSFPNSRRRMMRGGRGGGPSGFHAMDMQHEPQHESLQNLQEIEEMSH